MNKNSLNSNFTINDTSLIKGFAIMLMVIHHIYAFPERFSPSLANIPFLLLGSNSIELFIGQLGNFCIPIFLFLSGYGLFKSQNKYNWLLHIRRIFIEYWVVFLLFVPVGFLLYYNNLLNSGSDFSKFIPSTDVSRYEFSWGAILNNLFAYNTSFNSEWWFVFLYVELLLVFPFLRQFIRESSFFFSIGALLLIIVLSSLDHLLFNYDNLFLSRLSTLLLWLPSFLSGMISSKYNIFEWVELKLKSYPKTIVFHVVVFVILSVLVLVSLHFRLARYSLFYLVASFLMPLYIYIVLVVIKGLKLNRVFSFLGKHSLNIWLIHTFICYYYFQSIIIFFQYYFLAFFVTLLLSLLSSVLISPIQKVVIEKLFISKSNLDVSK